MFYAQENPLDASLPPIGLVFRTQSTEDTSDASCHTYYSNCSSIYATTDDDDYNQPPAASLPPSQAWGTTAPLPVDSTPSPYHRPAPAQPTSDPQPDELQVLQHENASLRRRVDTLTTQVQALLQHHRPKPPQPAQQQPPVLTIKKPMAATSEAVIRALQQGQLAQFFPPAQPPAQHEQYNTNTNVREADMSFESDMTNNDTHHE